MNPKPCAIIPPPGEKCGLVSSFSEPVQEQADEIAAEDVATRFDVDFSTMTRELTVFWKPG